jgi:hypothetical protein
MLKFQGFQRFRLQKYSKYSTVLKIKILETVEISRIWWWMIRGSNPGHPAGLETTLYLLIIYYFL